MSSFAQGLRKGPIPFGLKESLSHTLALKVTLSYTLWCKNPSVGSCTRGDPKLADMSILGLLFTMVLVLDAFGRFL